MRRYAAALLSMLLLFGCGSGAGSGPSSTPGALGDPAAYGVDVVDWPNTLPEAQGLLQALPGEVAGKHQHAAGGYALYGDEDFSVMVRAAERDARFLGTPEDPPAVLAAYAALQACDEASLTGTAPVADESTAGSPNDVWFSCHVSRSGDQPEAHVVGWTSGGVVWFVNAPSKTLVRALVSPLVAAASTLPGDGPGTRPTTTATAVSAPYGIEDVRWPRTVREAAGLVRRLAVLEGGGSGAGSPPMTLMDQFPSGDLFEVSPPQKGMSPSMMLAASFGLMYSCRRGTFEGTLPMIEGGRAGQPASGSTTRWFTCDVRGAEGDPSFRGRAVGWTSGPLAWLLIATDAERAETLMRALGGWAEHRH